MAKRVVLENKQEDDTITNKQALTKSSFFAENGRASPNALCSHTEERTQLITNQPQTGFH